MKKIIIKTDKYCGFLRTEAVSKAIYYEENLMKDRKEGIYNCAVWVKEGARTEYRFVIYHTKTAIVVGVSVDC